MAILNLDTQTSPGIGVLPDGVGFAVMGGCIIDLVGLNGERLTAQKSASSMFSGWTSPNGADQASVYPFTAWLIIATNTFDPTGFAAILGGGLAKANIRLTLYDGDSGSPNPVYQAMFYTGRWPYSHWTPQPMGYDFDGGQNLYIGFENVAGDPVNCGFMGESTTYRLGTDYSTVESFTGWPGVYALLDTRIPDPRPPQYLPPFPVTGWFSVPTDQLATLYEVLLTGTLKIGVHDITPGDQYYDFMQGLASDVINIPFAHVAGPSITCNHPPAGQVGVQYVHRMSYEQNTEFFTVAVTGGALPTGLSMYRDGTITGLPTLAGVFSFTTTVTDSLGQTDSTNCSITINQPTGRGNVAF